MNTNYIKNSPVFTANQKQLFNSHQAALQQEKAARIGKSDDIIDVNLDSDIALSSLALRTRQDSRLASYHHNQPNKKGPVKESFSLGRGGFEPPYSRENRFTVCRLQPLGHLPIFNCQTLLGSMSFICQALKMPLTRLELVTSPLPRECSTSEPQGLEFFTESHWQVIFRFSAFLL